MVIKNDRKKLGYSTVFFHLALPHKHTKTGDVTGFSAKPRGKADFTSLICFGTALCHYGAFLGAQNWFVQFRSLSVSFLPQNFVCHNSHTHCNSCHFYWSGYFKVEKRVCLRIHGSICWDLRDSSQSDLGIILPPGAPNAFVAGLLCWRFYFLARFQNVFVQ